MFIRRCDVEPSHDIERGRRHIEILFLNQNNTTVKTVNMCVEHAQTELYDELMKIQRGDYARMEAKWSDG